jgi:hypothetical protein
VLWCQCSMLLHKRANLTSCYKVTEVAFCRLRDRALAGLRCSFNIKVKRLNRRLRLPALFLGSCLNLAGWLDIQEHDNFPVES